MQPLIGNQGFGGVSYFSAIANQTNDPYNPGDGAIWMLGLGLDTANRFARRVDDGQTTGEIAQRYEPETYIGDAEVFVYYNKGLTNGANELRRARTGITTAMSAAAAATKPTATFRLSQNYPNPFNPNTAVGYQLSVASQVQLKVFDVLGREVATLVDAKQAAGNYAVNFNAKNLTSGIYFYRLQAGSSDGRSGSFIETKKMILVK
ncbi:MAG: T9SS type A sorting domain-containing protein [Rhizobacter sp.]|nr:T9SS type A sorting domain-containing protein [Chlorobiales bacterium]